MSAESNLAGFFPPDESEMWNKNIKWQPIPIHTIPEKCDNVLAAKKPCRRYEYALKKYQSSPEFKALCEKFAALFKYLEENSGAPIRTFDQAQYLYNTLYIENLRHLAYVCRFPFKREKNFFVQCFQMVYSLQFTGMDEASV